MNSYEPKVSIKRVCVMVLWILPLLFVLMLTFAAPADAAHTRPGKIAEASL